jgi:osmoprotectant transport system ATP-binding protein
MIRLENIVKKYGETTAVNNLNLEIRAGEICVLIGPSGCGKTTTLKMINRLIEPSSGKIFIKERDSSSLKPFELRRGIGYAIQSVGLFPHLTVSENIAVVPNLLNWEKSKIEARVIELLELIGLEPNRYAHTYPKALSGGQAQRVGVARALAADPNVLLFDEPFGAVDPLTRERLQNEFLELQKRLKKTVVFVTHDIDEAIKLADRIAILRDGKLEQFDTPEQILEQPANAFVRDFIGADRGLKRLARLFVRDVMRPSESIKLEEQVQSRSSSVFVVDRNGMLRGWLDRNTTGSSVQEAFSAYTWQDISVSENASVREALSRMISLGFQVIPVVSDAGILKGELTLEQALGAKGNA